MSPENCTLSSTMLYEILSYRASCGDDMHYGHFSKHLADELGTEERYQQLLKRRMQEAGHVPTGPRGMHGIHVDAENAAKLLIGSLISDDVGKAVKRFEHYAGLPNSAHPETTFLSALTALIERAGTQAEDDFVKGFSGLTLNVSTSWAQIDLQGSELQFHRSGTLLDLLKSGPNVAPFKVGKQVSVRIDPNVIFAMAEAIK